MTRSTLRRRVRVAAEGADLPLEPLLVLFLFFAVFLHVAEEGLQRPILGRAEAPQQRVVELHPGALECKPLVEQVDHLRGVLCGQLFHATELAHGARIRLRRTRVDRPGEPQPVQPGDQTAV